MKSRLRLVLTGLVTAALLNACGGGGGIGKTEASVRLVNASGDYSTLDLYESTNLLYSGVASYTPGNYTDIDAGSYTFNLKSGGSSAVAATTSGTISKRKHATIVASTTAGALTATYLSDEEDSPSSGTAKLRIFNTAKAEAGAVDVYVVATACAALASSSVAATASAVDGLQTGYTQVSAGAYHVCVTAGGDRTDLRLDLPTVTLADQQIVTLILTRTSGGVLLNGLRLDQQGDLMQALNTSARMRLAAGVGGNGAVVAIANGTTVASYTSPRVSGYQLIPSGALTLDVKVNGTAVALTGQTVAPGADTTLLVAGTVAAPQAFLLADDNSVSTSTTKPVKIRIVNGFYGASALTLDIDGTNVGSSAAFGKASTPGFVAAKDALASLLVTDASGNQVFLQNNVTLSSGSVYTLFLLGDPPTPPGTVTGSLRIDR